MVAGIAVSWFSSERIESRWTWTLALSSVPRFFEKVVSSPPDEVEHALAPRDAARLICVGGMLVPPNRLVNSL